MSSSSTASAAQLPVALVVPYLALSSPASFGGWRLSPLEQFDGPWQSASFEERARAFVGLFRDAQGNQLQRPSILTRTAEGANGERPSDSELIALRRAIVFAAIHKNPYWTRQESDAWGIVTADNAALWVQPIDHIGGRVTLSRGGRARWVSSGHKLTDPDLVIRAPLEAQVSTPITLDDELLDAVYGVVTDALDNRTTAAGAIEIAIRWLERSWNNSPSIGFDERLVFIKVAIEALTRESDNRRSASAMASTFRSTLTQEGDGLGLDRLLWSPDEPLLQRTYGNEGQKKQAQLTQLEHWACALGDARNVLVHGEKAVDHWYQAEDSPYNGPFVEIGDRVLRELITVELGRLGYPRVWRDSLDRAGLEHLKSAEN